jgi:hypothetical protein
LLAEQEMLTACSLMSLIWLTCVHDTKLVEAVSSDIKHVSILTVGDISKTAKISLPYTAPAIDSAMKKLRKTYAGIFNWSHTYLFDRNFTSFLDLPYYSEIMVAEWFYQRKPVADLIVFISSG